MSRLEKLLEILREFEAIIHLEEFEQFTIDFFQNNEMNVNVYIFDGYSETEAENVIDGLCYDVSCILDFVKEGKDKELFKQFEQKIAEL